MQANNRTQQFLGLVVIAPSLGVVMATYLYPGQTGQFMFLMTKIWLVLLPCYWRLKVENKAIPLPKINFRQVSYGFGLGSLMIAAILLAYWFIGKTNLDITKVREQAAIVGINKLSIYFLAVIYWSFVNSLIEESVWRGFIYRQCSYLQTQAIAIITAALFFTLHHIIGLFFYLQNSLLAAISSFGVFVAGVIWSACYQKVGFWACYISHIMADIAIALVGWHLLFI